MLKIETIPGIPNTPCRYRPFLQLSLVELPLQCSEQKEKIVSFVAALLECAPEQSPDISCKRAFPQHMTNRLAVVIAQLAFLVDSNSLFLEVLPCG